MKNMIKDIRKWLYWIDWEMVILGGLVSIICLACLALIIVVILGACGVIPMVEDTNTNTTWLSLITISNALRMMR